MKKILVLLLVCTMIFSLTLTMTSCDLFKNIFGDNQTDEPDTPDTPDDTDTPGIGSDDADIFEGVTNGGEGIELPITNVNSQDMTQQPEEGTEETPDAE